LKSNCLGVDGGKALAEGLKGNSVIKKLNIANNGLTNYGQGMSGVISLADVLPGMGAMTKIDISSNGLCAAGGKALAEALKNNHVVTELNIANNYLGTVDGDKLDMSGVIALANVIPDMRALTKRLTSAGTTSRPIRRGGSSASAGLAALSSQYEMGRPSGGARATDRACATHPKIRSNPHPRLPRQDPMAEAVVSRKPVGSQDFFMGLSPRTCLPPLCYISPKGQFAFAQIPTEGHIAYGIWHAGCNGPWAAFPRSFAGGGREGHCVSDVSALHALLRLLLLLVCWAVHWVHLGHCRATSCHCRKPGGAHTAVDMCFTAAPGMLLGLGGTHRRR
jgi:hypothetical protein